MSLCRLLVTCGSTTWELVFRNQLLLVGVYGHCYVQEGTGCYCTHSFWTIIDLYWNVFFWFVCLKYKNCQLKYLPREVTIQHLSCSTYSKNENIYQHPIVRASEASWNYFSWEKKLSLSYMLTYDKNDGWKRPGNTSIPEGMRYYDYYWLSSSGIFLSMYVISIIYTYIWPLWNESSAPHNIKV